jgi:hypothetical protein
MNAAVAALCHYPSGKHDVCGALVSAKGAWFGQEQGWH